MGLLTPMMQQYMEIKERYKDSILLFRLGDFYEMFFQMLRLRQRTGDNTHRQRLRASRNGSMRSTHHAVLHIPPDSKGL